MNAGKADNQAMPESSISVPDFLLRNKNQFLRPLPRTKCRWGAAFLVQSFHERRDSKSISRRLNFRAR
jgi:hypothetical protein